MPARSSRARWIGVAALAPSHPARIALLNLMSEFWQHDRNPLKSLIYLEESGGGPGASQACAHCGSDARSRAGSRAWQHKLGSFCRFRERQTV